MEEERTFKCLFSQRKCKRTWPDERQSHEQPGIRIRLENSYDNKIVYTIDDSKRKKKKQPF